MDRRSYLVTLGASIPLAGCSGLSEDQPSFSVTKPTVEQGETAIISIEATDVATMRFSDLPGELGFSPGTERVDIEFGNGEFTPAPDLVYKSHPPTWKWSQPQRIEATIPVQTFSDTPLGSYEFTISIWGPPSAEERTKRTTVTVVPTSTQ